MLQGLSNHPPATPRFAHPASFRCTACICPPDGASGPLRPNFVLSSTLSAPGWEGVSLPCLSLPSDPPSPTPISCAHIFTSYKAHTHPHPGIPRRIPGTPHTHFSEPTDSLPPTLLLHKHSSLGQKEPSFTSVGDALPDFWCSPVKGGEGLPLCTPSQPVSRDGGILMASALPGFSRLLCPSVKFPILASHWNHPVTQATPQSHSTEF